MAGDKGKNEPPTETGDTTDNRPLPRTPLTEMWDKTISDREVPARRREKEQPKDSKDEW
jgi:hypothetical protein